jgi:hypothetical protein
MGGENTFTGVITIRGGNSAITRKIPGKKPGCYFKRKK